MKGMWTKPHLRRKETLNKSSRKASNNNNDKNKNEAKPCQKKQARQKDIDKIAASRQITLRGDNSQNKRDQKLNLDLHSK